jgi:hypothetical protein
MLSDAPIEFAAISGNSRWHRVVPPSELHVDCDMTLVQVIVGSSFAEPTAIIEA